MTLTLNALNVKNGDALILTLPDGKTALIDGGPAGSWGGSIKSVLSYVFDKKDLPYTEEDERNVLDWVVVTHIDADHIAGVIELFDDPITSAGAAIRIKNMWYNSFDEIPENGLASLAVLGESASPTRMEVSALPSLILESVKQGIKLRKKANAMGVNLNSSPVKIGTAKVEVATGATFLPVAPDTPQLEKLAKDWDYYLKTDKEPKHGDSRSIKGNSNKSPTNLSSIVLYVEVGGNRLLLTGDSRGDIILDGLERAKVIEAGGKIHLDLLKIQHHGSYGNANPDFFRRVTADNYLVCTNGHSHNHPDPLTLEWLFASRPVGESFNLWFVCDPEKLVGSNRDAVVALLEKEEKKRPGLRVIKPSGELGVEIKL